MDLFDKLQPMRAAVAAMDEVNPFDVTIEAVLSPSEVIIAGRRTLMFGSNNYLGLSFDERPIKAGIAALGVWGTGTTGSRVANGTLTLHRDLEHALANAFGFGHARLFTTGHQANLAMIAGLCSLDDAILLDSESHASIFDGARLSGATTIAFRHNDTNDLRKKLQRLPEGHTNRLVIVEGLYSTSGDVAPLGEIADACKAEGAYLLVDEAHSFGVYGARGLGLAEAQCVLDRVDFVVGTFSKSLGSVGGFCVSNHDVLELLHFAARAYVFTASSSASTIAAAHAALDALLAASELRQRLGRNVRRFRRGLHELGLSLGSHETPIIAIQIGEPERALALWNALFEEGIYVNLVLPPACPRHKARLRASCTAVHTDEQIDAALTRFARALARVHPSTHRHRTAS